MMSKLLATKWWLGVVLCLTLAGIAHASPTQCYPDAQSAYQALNAKQTQSQNNKININTASMGELATLHGVGAKTAHAIIQYRQTHGAFNSIDDLTKVKGIGAKTLEKNRQRLTVF